MANRRRKRFLGADSDEKGVSFWVLLLLLVWHCTMYKQSPSRNHRSKGFKVKHILQICLLLAIFFWLIYQLKRSHENKKDFDAKDAKIVVGNGGDVIMFGRKDLSRLDIATKDGKHGEEEDENEGEVEENQQEEDEQEREESRTKEREEEEEDVSKGGDDYELDEREQENEVEAENEELVDEENDREDDSGEKSEENEDREAREEHYKADDASSEVADDLKTIITQSKNATFKHPKENREVNNSGRPNKTETSPKTDADTIKSGLQLMSKGQMGDHGSSSMARAANSTQFEDILIQNSTILKDFNDMSEEEIRSAEVNDKGTSLSSSETQMTFNSTQTPNIGQTFENNKLKLRKNYRFNSDKIVLEIESSNKNHFVNTHARESTSSSANFTTAEVKEISEKLTDDIDDDSKIQSSGFHPTNTDGDVLLHDPIDASDTFIAKEGEGISDELNYILTD
ncbi:hypothetical protein Nepgr_025546 [Nepenthes gracilis]|uniref:Uncharacterized protein n=1 Tax=Nepenthes gracilis TaxID=150966 RepID=A0AAD3T546_NEPGR|nr:hypothetical protein Nepgr_025546 [Nepenthes gracilis]